MRQFRMSVNAFIGTYQSSKLAINKPTQILRKDRRAEYTNERSNECKLFHFVPFSRVQPLAGAI
jgi:hypothetical protein